MALITCDEGHYFPDSLNITFNLTCEQDAEDVTIGQWSAMPSQDCTGTGTYFIVDFCQSRD